METTTTCHSESHYVDAFFFEKGQVIDHKLYYYTEVQAHTMFQRVVNKYRDGNKEVLVTLRTIDHEILKSELIKALTR